MINQSIQSRITLITASCKNPIEHSVGQSVADRLSVRLQAGITTVCSRKVSNTIYRYSIYPSFVL